MNPHVAETPMKKLLRANLHIIYHCRKEVSLKKL
jgi:hypothetical protein